MLVIAAGSKAGPPVQATKNRRWVSPLDCGAPPGISVSGSEMSTLYLSAPFDKSQFSSAFYKDYFTILQSGIGPDHAIYSTLIGSIVPGMRVVVFDRVRHQQAEGTVNHLVPKPSNRVPRYDVYIDNLAVVAYNGPHPVNRCGVEVR